MEFPTTALKSFIEDAANSPFSINNLPYGAFQQKGTNQINIGTAIGNYVLNLTLLESESLLKTPNNILVFNQDSLNLFAAQGPKVWSSIRKRLKSLLSQDNQELQNNSALLKKVLIPLNEVTMQLPFKIGGYTDFYASENHATNVGRLFRPNDNALLPNWKHIPVGYNGRASTVFTNGTAIHRPKGQIKSPTSDNPIFTTTKKLDFELELGFFVGTGNPDGQPIPVEEAKNHIFGLVLLNDWSARDIQAFEYQPLGPFLSKSFATSISPWVVPYEAIAQAMTQLPKQNPEPVAYLYQDNPKQPDIQLRVELQPSGSTERTLLCETNSKELYWSMEQMLAHHTVNNCIMRPGDLLGTGTISGQDKSSWGSLLELSFNGKEPITLKDGKQRSFLEDGDTVIMSGYCQIGDEKIGFGTLEGTIHPCE